MGHTIRVAKTKALISFVVTAKLICVFFFAFAKIRFSHNEAQKFGSRGLSYMEALVIVYAERSRALLTRINIASF